MPSLAELFSGLDVGDDDEAKPLPEASIMEMRDLLARYNEAPFEVGDLVTPRKNAPVRGAGDPHIVLERRDGAVADPHTSTGEGNGRGRRYDMRVACHMTGHLSMFWVESCEFEPYTGPGA